MSKKARSTRGADVEEEITIEAKLKFELIEQTLQKSKLKRMVSYLCEVMSVSTIILTKNQRKIMKAIILKAYHFRGRKKGARQIKMTLQNQYGITYNLK